MDTTRVGAVAVAVVLLLSGCTGQAEPAGTAPVWTEVDATAAGGPTTWVDVTDSASRRKVAGEKVPVLHVGRVATGTGPPVAAVWEGPVVDVDSAHLVGKRGRDSVVVDLDASAASTHLLGRERVEGRWRHFVQRRDAAGRWSRVDVPEVLDTRGVLATGLGSLPDGALVVVGVDEAGAHVAVHLGTGDVSEVPLPVRAGAGDVQLVQMVSTGSHVVLLVQDVGEDARAWTVHTDDGRTWSTPRRVGPAGVRVRAAGITSPTSGTLVAAVEVAPRPGAKKEGRAGDVVYTTRDLGEHWREEVFVADEKGSAGAVLSRPATGRDGEVVVAHTGIGQGHSAIWRRSTEGEWEAGQSVPGWWYHGISPVLAVDGDAVVAYRQIGTTSEVRRGAKVTARTHVDTTGTGDEVWATDARLGGWAGTERVVVRDQVGATSDARVSGRVLTVTDRTLTPGRWPRVDFERTPPHVVASAGDASGAVALSNELSGDGWESLVRASSTDGQQWRVVPVQGNTRMLLFDGARHDPADTGTWWLTGTDLEGYPQVWRAESDLSRFASVALPSQARRTQGSISASCTSTQGDWFVISPRDVPDDPGTVLLRQGNGWRDVAALPSGFSPPHACAGVGDNVLALARSTGRDGSAGSRLLLSFDGSAWDPVALSDDVRSVLGLWNVDGTAVARVVVGDGARQREALLLSRDGSEWVTVALPDVDVEQIEDVAARGPALSVLVRTPVGRRLWRWENPAAVAAAAARG
ncbi:hypothetical protein [Nocardioides yefusunii]|uniref:Exo-alpha-sialidase n=1 Tax=Nocardioides yefusunii TaxID=2500546 RepID=A0ABW1R3G7_9ACTN|nr:hypothetical protein [Nocardioides yefusunii]